MADAEEKARQEKLAAAKKRVDAMKKKKKGAATKKPKAEPAEAAAEAVDSPEPDATEKTEEPQETQEPDEEASPEEPAQDELQRSRSPSIAPSLAQQSKMRSTSFRAGSAADSTSPGPQYDGDTAPEIYRKHVARIEELEKENKRLSKDVTDGEKRWKKAEEELADLREADGEEAQDKVDGGDVTQLKSEIESLRRQNSQLQQKSRGHGHRASISMSTPPAELQAELDSKTKTIETMEIEISKLKAQVERQETGTSTEKEQVTALEEKLARAEGAAGKAQRELQDLKRNLERTAEQAVREGSERTSAETKVKTLETALEEANAARKELEQKVEALDKKVATLTTLHKEQDSRLQAVRKEKEKADKELAVLREESSKAGARKSTDGGGLDDEGVDELEDEERQRLQRRIRSLESELHEMRSGQWIGKRRELEATSPGFQDVDLSSGNAQTSSHRRTATAGGIGDFFTSGLNALAGTGGGDDEFLDDDDMEFDEDAFRKAQEDESKKRIERIKEIKRSLKHWEGWRLDIVENRRGGTEGIGEIFDV